MFKLKKAVVATMLAGAIFSGGIGINSAYASEIPKGSSEAPMLMQESGIDGRTTISGNGGSAWVNLTSPLSKTSQASFGSKSTVGTMANVSWGLAYSDGKTKTGTNFPMSTSWNNQHVQKHNSSGYKTVTLTGTAFLTNGKVLAIMNPTTGASIK